MINANIIIFKGFVGFPGPAGPPGIVTEGPPGLKGNKITIIQLLVVPLLHKPICSLLVYLLFYLIFKYSNKV
jgi:hypothetical protein